MSRFPAEIKVLLHWPQDIMSLHISIQTLLGLETMLPALASDIICYFHFLAVVPAINKWKDSRVRLIKKIK